MFDPRQSFKTLLLTLLVTSSTVCWASDDALTKGNQTIANPLADQTLWITENNFFRVDGNALEDAEEFNALIIDPLIPQKLNDDWNLVHRPIVPFLTSVNVPTGIDPITGELEDTSESGLGDIIYWAAFSPNTSGSFHWGLGPLIKLPTAHDGKLGEEKVSLGNVFIALYSSPKFSAGINNNNYFSVGGLGDGDRDSVNVSTLQYFWFYSFTPKWGIGSAPTITYDWDADSDNDLELPIGLGVTRSFMLGGKYPTRLLFEYQNFLENKDSVGTKWNFRIAMGVVLPLFE